MNLTITAGSFVRIFDSSGTSFCVRFVYDGNVSVSDQRRGQATNLIEGLYHAEERHQRSDLHG